MTQHVVIENQCVLKAITPRAWQASNVFATVTGRLAEHLAAEFDDRGVLLLIRRRRMTRRTTPPRC